MNSSMPPVDAATLVATIAFLIVWALVRLVIRWVSGSRWKWLLAPISLLAAWAFWTSTLSVIESQFETTGTWPRGVVALMTAMTCEAVLTLYVDHRRSIPGWVPWIPIGLRLSLVLLLAFILLGPSVSHHEEESQQRQVAVLIDASASMDWKDPSMSDDPTSRREFVRQLLLEQKQGNATLLDQLESDYHVRLFEFASTPHEMSTSEFRSTQVADDQGQRTSSKQRSSEWAKHTDMAAAIRRVDDQVSLDELSGMIIVTDGCDHSRDDLEASARRLVHRKIPIHTILVGDQTPHCDAEVTTVQTPKQVFHGDSVTVRAAIKADQLSGESLHVRLVKDKETIAQRTIEVRDSHHRETVVFRDQPKQIGVHQYTIEIDPVPGESIQENNRTSSRVWVSKDSIRMLIVENRPRWEFRYLRNLFAGRDRSVHLQYVLLRPDRLAAVPDPPIMHASVNRTFDDCEATALPENEAEWLKFDVIVLGDVAPDDLGKDVLRTLEKFVANRAGTLVVLSGRQHMPHAFAQTPLADLLPVRLDDSRLDDSRLGDATSPDSEYSFKMASGAESHVIMQQSTDARESESVWRSLPQLHWRHPASRAKAGATVLAYAGRDREAEIPQGDQRNRALMLWHRFGAGRVMQLTFDETWRLRYGIGDKRHHRFWGQVLRWSVQDRLSAGTEWVRMGTDRVLYRSGESVTVRARLLDGDRNPVESDDTVVSIYRNDELIQRTRLSSQVESGGMLMATIDGLNRVGKYRVELTGPTVEQLLRTEGRTGEVVSVDFAVEGSDPLVEMSDRVADANVPSQLASWTGGIVVNPSDADEVLDRLGPKSTFHREQWTVPMWNRWPTILVFLLIVGVEWVLRKSSGLI